MNRYKTAAIVLASVNFGDADRILTLFTENRGKVRATAFGSRRPKNSLSALMPFYEIEAELSEGTNLDTLRQANIINVFDPLEAGLLPFAYGSFVAETAEEFFAENQPDEEVFALLKIVFSALKQKNPRVVALIAAWQLIYYAGVGPALLTCASCGAELGQNRLGVFDNKSGGILCRKCAADNETTGEEISETLRQFIITIRDFNWQNKEPILMRRNEILGAERIILSYMRFLTGKEPRTLKFIRELNNA